MPIGVLKDETGRVVGYSYGCSRGSTGPLCKFCRKGRGERRCDYRLRGGKTCNAYLCTDCAAHRDPEEDFCPDHRERAGLGPPPSVARHRERRAAREKRRAALEAAPPRWIDCSRYAGPCRRCGTGVAAGSRILYFADRSLMCDPCGRAHLEGGEDSTAGARATGAGAAEATSQGSETL